MESRLEDSIHIPKGFRLGSTAVGIKESGRPDISLLCSDSENSQDSFIAAGVYTQNIIRATSIDWCRNITPSETVRGVIVNSGNANACTGDEGVRNNQVLAELAAKVGGGQAADYLVLSTGIIGHQLPIDQIQNGIDQVSEQLGSSQQSVKDFCYGMTTTDKFLKIRSTKWEENGQTYNLTVIAKGAGMIGPNMATMLSVVMTDFPLSTQTAQETLSKATEKSFNRIRVDGHTSTNDAVLLLSSRKAEKDADIDLSQFQTHLESQMIACAKLIPEDGEGATKVMELAVSGCQEDSSAKQIAFAIADSPLVKTAIFGCDPNWGRIVSAAGYAGVDFLPKEVSLKILGTTIYQAGIPVQYDEQQLSDLMRQRKEILVELVVGNGIGRTTVWASDLTTEYVKFNSDYST